jgi:superfamily II DNA or RNA helicase
MSDTDPSQDSETSRRLSAIEAELAELRSENARFRALLGLEERDGSPRATPTSDRTVAPTPIQVNSEEVSSGLGVSQSSSSSEKVALFRSLFVGRDDVYASAWSSQRTGKKGWSPAVLGGIANAKSPHREYLPFTEEVVERHLAGEMHVGIYPLLYGDVCHLLACDFDGPGWVLDAGAYLEIARSLGIPGLLERSRSGDGGHVWIFFSGPIPASSARRLGVHLLREAMTVRAEIDLASYDRLFPTQDFMPRGSFGNLIALPLQGACRKRGTTVFLDPRTMEPYADQWEQLSSVEPVTHAFLEHLVDGIGDLETGPDTRTLRRTAAVSATVKPPSSIDARAGAMLSIDRVGVPPAMVAALKHAASLHNPEFYEKERMRFSTWNTPRFIRCYREALGELQLPRGLRDAAERIVAEAGSELRVVDVCHDPEPIAVELVATLTADQSEAVEALVPSDLGMLVAPPGSGKTVVGCALIARHRVPTLVIVDRKPLVDQWRERLVTHLDIDAKQIGQLGGGRSKTKGLIDIVMVQSLARRDDIAELTGPYGMVIVDECHHVPAVTFERAVREIPVRRWVGLTATPYRRDGLQAMMAMHCGPVRHSMSVPVESDRHSLQLVVHPTVHEAVEDGQHIQTTFRGLVEDKDRTAAICDDIADAAAKGRNCLVLTRWTEHLGLIATALEERGIHPLVMHGQMGKKARTVVLQELNRSAGSVNGFVLAATASLLGEGFDCPPLDTLFLAFPIKFKGSVVQYVGRVLRPTADKTRVEVHDYVDASVPVLARMHQERRKAYASLGFDVPKKGGSAG